MAHDKYALVVRHALILLMARHGPVLPCRRERPSDWVQRSGPSRSPRPGRYPLFGALNGILGSGKELCKRRPWRRSGGIYTKRLPRQGAMVLASGRPRAPAIPGRYLKPFQAASKRLSVPFRAALCRGGCDRDCQPASPGRRPGEGWDEPSICVSGTGGPRPWAWGRISPRPFSAAREVFEEVDEAPWASI